MERPVYGSFLVASAVGAAFEAGADARTLTGSAFVSMLASGLPTCGSEVVGEHVSAGSRFTLGASRNGRWSKLQRFPQPS